MSKFDAVLNELRDLQSRLQAGANRLWVLRLTLASAYQNGHTEADFLPRRLARRETAEQREFERLINRLNHVISRHLDGSLIAFSSKDDVETVASISRTIRYIHNSFAGDTPVGRTWAKLNAALPAFSRN